MNLNLNIDFQTFFVSVLSLAAAILGGAIVVISKVIFQSTFDAAAVGMAVDHADLGADG